MKLVQVLSTAVVLLLPGAVAPAYAWGQREQEKEPERKQQQQAKPAQQQQQQHAEHQQQQAKPTPQQQPQRAEKQQQAKPAQQQQQRAEHQQEAKPAQQQQRAERQPQQQVARPAQQPQRVQERQQANRVQSAAGHGRIPDDRFRASFGRSHTFHVNRAEFVGGSRRFQYGGFWFNVMNPWPEGWLYTDAVYVDYMNGGYFLCDPVHPGVYLSINVG